MHIKQGVILIMINIPCKISGGYKISQTEAGASLWAWDINALFKSVPCKTYQSWSQWHSITYKFIIECGVIQSVFHCVAPFINLTYQTISRRSTLGCERPLSAAQNDQKMEPPYCTITPNGKDSNPSWSVSSKRWPNTSITQRWETDRQTDVHRQDKG